MDIIETLEKLNRKERFFLVGMALGNPNFTLHSQFRRRLEDEFKLNIPANAFVAMDYHLNWIYAACEMSFGKENQTCIYPNDGIVDGTQEDVDLLVAYEDPAGKCQLVMLEAKGVTAFSNEQFKHKIERFKSIFGENGDRWSDQVIPHFGLVSPREPEKLDTSSCPDWLLVDGEVAWLEMRIPEGRLTVFGCDQNGHPDEKRPYWTIK